MTDVQMTVRRPGTCVAVIDIEGDVMADSKAALEAAYEEVGPSVRAVVLNFSGLGYMNSSGIGMLVTLLVGTNRARQRLLAFGLSDHYREIFSLTRLDEAIAVVERAAAVQIQYAMLALMVLYTVGGLWLLAQG